MNQKDNRIFIGHLFALFCVTAWGTSFLVSQHLMEKLMPAQLMWLRFLIAYLAMWIICPRWRLSWKEDWQGLILSLIGNTLYFLAENTALRLSLASNVSILVSTAPILSVFLTWIFHQGEKLSGTQLLGVGIAFVGVLLVVFNGVFILKLNPAGDLLAFAAAFCWAAYNLLAKRLLGQFDSALLTRKLMFYGMLTSAPLLLNEGSLISELDSFSLLDVCGLLYLGLICSALCYLLWNTAIDSLGAVRTNLYVYFVPLVTLLASALFLGEKITGVGLIGIILVILGMIMSSFERGSRQTEHLPD